MPYNYFIIVVNSIDTAYYKDLYDFLLINHTETKYIKYFIDQELINIDYCFINALYFCNCDIVEKCLDSISPNIFDHYDIYQLLNCVNKHNKYTIDKIIKLFIDRGAKFHLNSDS